MRSKGDGTFITLPAVGDSSLHDFTPYFIDINSDGKADIVWDKIDSSRRSLGERRLWLGKGDGTFIWQSNLAGQDGTCRRNRCSQPPKDRRQRWMRRIQDDAGRYFCLTKRPNRRSPPANAGQWPSHEA